MRPFNGAAEPPPVVRRTAPSNTRIKLTAKFKSLTAFSLLAAYPPPRYAYTPIAWYEEEVLKLELREIEKIAKENYSAAKLQNKW